MNFQWSFFSREFEVNGDFFFHFNKPMNIQKREDPTYYFQGRIKIKESKSITPIFIDDEEEEERAKKLYDFYDNF